jgi:hypothetical protein
MLMLTITYAIVENEMRSAVNSSKLKAKFIRTVKEQIPAMNVNLLI